MKEREREFIALLSLSSWCLVIVVWLFLAVPWVCLQFVIVVFPHLLFLWCYVRYIYLVKFKSGNCGYRHLVKQLLCVVFEPF